MKHARIIVIILLPFILIGIWVLKARHDIVKFTRNNSPALRMEKVFLPEEGVVPDEKAAIAWAKQVWARKYGHAYLIPFVYDVSLQENRLWVIEGVNVFYCMFGINGGGPYIIIDKYTGEVINVTHTH